MSASENVIQWPWAMPVRSATPAATRMIVAS